MPVQVPGPDAGPSLLVVAHPGHEVRVHGWLESARPTVCVLTDGSGHTDVPRVASSADVVAHAGARRGPIFGALSDRALYEALRTGQVARFATLASELAALIVRRRIALVVGDAAEGFNPGHDVCRFVIDAAVALAARSGQAAANLEFVLDAAPGDRPAHLAAADMVRVTLDDAALVRKLAAARGYVELRDEVDTALARFGTEAFRHEWLRPPATARAVAAWDETSPFFERHGRARVAQGVYAEPLTWRTHLRPVYDGLVRLAEAAPCVYC